MDSSDVASPGEVFQSMFDFSQETLILCRETVFVRKLGVVAMLEMCLGLGGVDPAAVHISSSSCEFATGENTEPFGSLLSFIPTPTDLLC